MGACRRPESKKATLKAIILNELGRVLGERPELKVVAIADGAKDNWTFLKAELLDSLPENTQKIGILDFYHAAEHLNVALGAAYGEGTVQARAMFDKPRRIFLEDPKGVEKIIRSLVALCKRLPSTEKLK